MGLWNSYKKYSGLDAAESFLRPDKGYKDAMKQFQKAWEEAKGFGRPYVEGGHGQLPFLNNARDQLFDPAKLQGEWAEGYEVSPEALDLMRRMKELGMEDASSMGLMGSSAALENNQRTAGSIVASDRQRYMDDLMRKYMASIGIGENIYNTGAGVAGNMMNNAMQYGNNMGAGAFGKRNAPGQLFGQGAGMAARFFGGGM